MGRPSKKGDKTGKGTKGIHAKGDVAKYTKKGVNFARVHMYFMFFFSFVLERYPHVLIINLHMKSVY